MTSRGWFYVLYMLVFVVLIYLVDLAFGKLYARYVLAFTGVIFLVGMLFGQRTEKKWEGLENQSE